MYLLRRAWQGWAVAAAAARRAAGANAVEHRVGCRWSAVHQARGLRTGGSAFRLRAECPRAHSVSVRAAGIGCASLPCGHAPELAQQSRSCFRARVPGAPVCSEPTHVCTDRPRAVGRPGHHRRLLTTLERRRCSQGRRVRGQCIHRTANASTADLQHMRVDHRRADVRMAEQLLHRANVVAGLQQVRSKRVPQGVRRRGRMDTRRLQSPLEGALKGWSYAWWRRIAPERGSTDT